MNPFKLLAFRLSSIVEAEPIGAEEARRLLRRAGVDLEAEIDLTDYERISLEMFGRTLVFTPASGKDRRLVVQLTSFTEIPKIVLLLRADDGSWVDFQDPGAYAL
jgi:hypothetical protein